MSATITYTMFDTAIAAIAQAAEDTTDSKTIDVSDVEVVAVQLVSTGENASITGNLVAKLVGAVHPGGQFDTQIFATVTLTQTDNSAEAATGLVNVRGLSELKVTAIENEDATYDATSVQVNIGKTTI